MVRVVARARNVTLVAYQLPRGKVLDALEAAAHRGARVEVRLEGRPFPDERGGIARHNRHVVDDLRLSGADARLADASGDVPLHAKAACIDGALYLDDVNFTSRGTLLRVTAHSPTPVWSKTRALALEAGLLARRRSGVEVETESIGSGNAVYAKLLRLGLAHEHPRLLVSSEAVTARERARLARLVLAGVEVRTCGADEKFAISGARAWIGSANATAPYPKVQTIDWGLSTRNRSVIAALRAQFERRWQHARAASTPSRAAEQA
jgi:hypothetical protein